MTKGKELTDAQKGAILALIPFCTHAEIGAQLGIPRGTISRFVERAQKCDSIENLPRPGRQWKLTNTAVHYLVCNTEANSCVSFKELQNLINADVSI